MNRTATIIGGQVVVLGGFLVGVARHWFPLGVPGEWEWQRLAPSIRLDPVSLGSAGLALALYVAFATAGARALARGGSVARELAWVAALAVAGVLVQAAMQEGAPAGYGLAKWILALGNKGSSGYHAVARDEMPAGLAPFLARYPTWVAGQDSLHIGTHPPGLFVVARAALDLMRRRPALARRLVEHAPGSVGPAIVAARGSSALGRDEAAALLATGAAILLGSALTVVPLYALARASGPPAPAWAAAAAWPLVPAALMFQPTADAAFPLLAATATAAAAWAARARAWRSRAALAIGAGVALAVGMEFTLAFLAVGLVVAIILLGSPDGGGRRAGSILVGCTGVGFAAATAGWWLATAADPLATWWINQAHHARFYRDYPRGRLAWAAVNPVEAAAALGLPVAVLALAAFARPRGLPAATWGTIVVLIALTASGRSLSEVGRLWLPLFPPLLVAAGRGWEVLGGRPPLLAATLGLTGCQTLALQASIQVVYPI